jgi:hypothetical protein
MMAFMLVPCEEENWDGEDLCESDKEDRESQLSFGQLGGTPASTSAPRTVPKPKREEKRKCGLCKNMQPIADWPVHCPHCRRCKQAIDNLSYASKAQGQDAWWKQQRKDEASLRAVIKKYQEQCPAPAEKGKNRGVFNLVKYIEEFKAKSAVINNDVGEMMCRSRYLAFAQTFHNPEGILTEKQAETRWAEMEQAANSGEWLHDKNGPAKEQLQLRIRTSSQIIFQDEFSHAKLQQSQQQKDLKKASQADVEAGRRSLLRDHERGLGKDGEHKDFGGIAQAMLQTAQQSSGASRDSAFAGPGVFLPNMQSMQDELAEDEARKKAKAESKKQRKSNGSAGSAADEEEGTDDEPEPQQPKSNWFDEGFVNRAKRTQETQQSKCEESVNKTLQTAVQQLADAPQTAHDNPTREKETLKSRLKFLLHVAGYGEVDDWSAISGDAFSNAPTNSEESQVQGLKQLIQSCNEARPPCENYKQLEPLQAIKNSLMNGFQDLLDKARSKEEVVAFVKAIQSRRQPIAKLCQAVNKAAKDLKSTFNSKKRVAQQAPESTPGSHPSKKLRVSGTTPGTPKVGAKTSMPLFAAAQTHATKICVVQLKGPDNEVPDQPLDLAAPVLFTAGTWKSIEAEPALFAAAQSFTALWKAAELRTTQKKASQKLVGSCEALARSFLAKPLEKWLRAVPSDDSFKDLCGSLHPSVFASCAGSESVYIEKDACPCVRLTVQGIREVVMAPISSWAKVGLAGQSSAAGKGMIQRICGSFMHAAPAVVQAGRSHVYFATIGPADLLYTPAGWIVAERVQQTASKTADVTPLQLRCESNVQ